MNLIDSASLVVTPNGYKTSKLYSIVPTDGTGDFVVTRAGDTATRVNSSGNIEAVTANKPRLDYLASTCPKVLLETQRTNLLQRSNEFDNVYWTKLNTTITANSNVSPDGTSNGETLNTTAVTLNLLRAIVTTTISTVYSVSVFVKKTNYRYIGLKWVYSGDTFNFYDFDTNTANNTASPTNPILIQNYGNGWVRLSMKATATATTHNFDIGYVNSSGSNAAVPAGTETYFIYGAQLEAGAAASSYIPTTTASVTRSADTCTRTTSTALIGQTEGTVFFEIDYKLLGEDGYRLVLHDTGTSYANLIYFRINTSSSFAYTLTTGSASQASGSRTLTVGRHKIALAYKANDIAFFVDGVLVSSDTTNTIPPLNEITFGNGIYGATTNIINYFALWKTRLSNAEILTLTTL
jgi:hypothetical protein